MDAGAHWTDIPAEVMGVLRRGAVLPAHPLALDEDRRLNRVSQRALSRCCYMDATPAVSPSGCTPPVQIRDVGLYRPVLELAAETAGSWSKRPLILISVIGKTAQAVEEARTARALGYHAVLLGLGALKGASEDELIAHCAAVAGKCFGAGQGFYLQTAVGEHSPLARLLDPLCGDRQRDRHQGRAVQSLRRWTWRSAWWPAPRSASLSTPATTTTSSPTC